MELAALLKLAPFVVKETGDPEQLMQDFKEYIKTFNKFLLATKVVGEHTASREDCGACVQARATLELVGGKEITWTGWWRRTPITKPSRKCRRVSRPRQTKQQPDSSYTPSCPREV